MDEAITENIHTPEEDDRGFTRRAFVKATVAGLYKSRGVAAAVEGLSVLMPLKATQNFYLTFNKVDAAQIVLKPNVDENAARAEIQKLLPEGVTMRRPEARDSSCLPNASPSP